MSDELDRMWKEVGVVYFKGLRKNIKTVRVVTSISEPRIELGI
jgi:hypothetical protein